MAHGRDGPDIVMQVRYAGASEVRAVTDHELNRSPDGWSAIDPARVHLNAVLHGPVSQQVALDQMWSEGVRKPASQAEQPFVQMVLSASPSYFRDEGQGPGEWDEDRLELWQTVTMEWLRSEYGNDLAHVSLHLDEETPHLHILIVPTYEKKARKPGRQKRGESDGDFAARIAEAEARPAIRTAGRSSSPYWSRMFCRRDARKSYHLALEREGMDIGYGKDFVEEGQPSPETTPTGVWVRKEAAKVAEDRAALDAAAAALASDRTTLDHDRATVAEDRAALDAAAAALASDRTALDHDRATVAEDRAALDAAAAALASDRTTLDHDRATVAEDRAALDAAAAALASDRTTLDHDRATVAEDRAALDAAAAALASDRTALAGERAQLTAQREASLTDARAWAARLNTRQAEIDKDQADFEKEKAHVQKMADHFSGLIRHVEKALKVVMDLAPRIRRVLVDAEASADDRAAARVIRTEIVDVVPSLRMAHTAALFTRKKSAGSAPEKAHEPVEESAPGFGEP